MPKSVTRAVVLGIVWATTQAALPLGVLSLVTAPPAAYGADHEFPVMNSVGRFLGVGYTRGGYHAAQDGRFNVISDRHPAVDYRPGGLPQYVQPQYRPQRSVVGSGPSPVLAPVLTDGTPRHSGPSADSPSNTSPKNKPTAVQADAPDIPVAPAKPSEPPPRWLEEYLQQSEAGKQHEIPLPQDSMPQDRTRPNGTAPQASPSDVLLDKSSAGIDGGHGFGYSIIDSGFPDPVYQSPAQYSAAQNTNRYR